MPEYTQPLRQSENDDEGKQDSLQPVGDERPTEKDAPSCGTGADTGPRSPRLGPLGRLDICQD